MVPFACRLLGEIRYPEDYSFERVAAIETEVGAVLARVRCRVARGRSLRVCHENAHGLCLLRVCDVQEGDRLAGGARDRV